MATKKSRNTDYKTIGAISGYFPKRAKTERGMTAEERALLAKHVATARARGLSVEDARTYVADRMRFDAPTAPYWEQYTAAVDASYAAKQEG